MNKFISILLVLVVSSGIFSQPIDQKKVFEVSPGLIDNKNKIEEETPARRAEIIFLISLPFTALLSFLLFNGIYFLSDTSYSFTTATLPPEIIPFSILSALVTSGMISYNDYAEEQKRKKLSLKEDSETSEFRMGLTLKKKF